jgi:hypothetical protein
MNSPESHRPKSQWLLMVSLSFSFVHVQFLWRPGHTSQALVATTATSRGELQPGEARQGSKSLPHDHKSKMG